MKKKTLVVIVIVIVMAISLMTGCSNTAKVPEEVQPEEEIIEEVEEAVEETAVTVERELLEPAMIKVENLPKWLSKSDLEDGFVSTHRLMEIAKNKGEDLELEANGKIYTIKPNMVLYRSIEIAADEENDEPEEIIEEPIVVATETPFQSGLNQTQTAPNQPATPSQPSQPSAPSQPAAPSQPSQPSASSQPATPSQPSQPSAPNKPATPSQPSQPGQPSNPSTPSQPSTPAAHTHSYGNWALDGSKQYRTCSCGHKETKDAGKRWIVDVPAKDAEYVEIPHYDSYETRWVTYTTNLNNHNDKTSWITKEFIIGYSSTVEEFVAFEDACQQNRSWVNGGFYNTDIYTYSDWIETSPAQEEQGHWEYYIIP